MTLSTRGFFRLSLLVLPLLAASPLLAQPKLRPAQDDASHRTPTALQTEILRLAAAAKGVVGVSAWRLDGRGPRIAYHEDQFFPMASTFKVAVAATILSRVDRGELAIGQMINVKPEQYSPSDVIATEFIHPGVSLSVHNLLELMITHSDNTATDVLTELAGGPAEVTAWLRSQGIQGQRIDRDTNGLFRDIFDLPRGGTVREAFEVAIKADPTIEARGEGPLPAYDNDPRDTSTPEAMASLLTRIFNGKALTPSSTKVLTDIMERTKTGTARLKGLLPEGTVVAHKTGTFGGTVNDVGVMTLPGSAGQVVIAVYIKKSDAPIAVRERTIAEIARTVHDFYLFSVPVG